MCTVTSAASVARKASGVRSGGLVNVTVGFWYMYRL